MTCKMASSKVHKNLNNISVFHMLLTQCKLVSFESIPCFIHNVNNIPILIPKDLIIKKDFVEKMKIKTPKITIQKTMQRCTTMEKIS